MSLAIQLGHHGARKATHATWNHPRSRSDQYPVPRPVPHSHAFDRGGSCILPAAGLETALLSYDSSTPPCQQPTPRTSPRHQVWKPPKTAPRRCSCT